MRREEKRRRFNEAVVNTLYPPPSPPQQEEEEKPVNILGADFDVDLIPDDLEERSDSTTTSDAEPGSQKPTRAQRKRLRKKMLKEDASRRGNIIGPLVPSIPISDEQEHPGVRQNATDKRDPSIDHSGEEPACANQNKAKNRRLAKRLAKERSKSCNIKNCNQNQSPQC